MFGITLNIPSLIFGLLVFLGGIVLMFLHYNRWRRVEIARITERVRSFEYQKFRRRTVVGSLIAACGAIIASLSRETHPYMFVATVTALVLMLLLILTLATIDLMTVGLYQFATHKRQHDRETLEKMIHEHRVKQAAEKPEEEAPSKEDQK